MKGKKLTIYTCFSVLIIVLSFVVYFGFSTVEKTDIQNTSFAFTIISEILFFAMIYLMTRKEENTFSRAGILSTTAIYLIISLIINVIAKSMFETVRTIIVTNCIVLILYIAIVLVVYLFKKEK